MPALLKRENAVWEVCLVPVSIEIHHFEFFRKFRAPAEYAHE